tara:strand:+ start:1811 stop:2728 length:918 start_codon:yes stop_codon:yes gene_type:complete
MPPRTDCIITKIDSNGITVDFHKKSKFIHYSLLKKNGINEKLFVNDVLRITFTKKEDGFILIIRIKPYETMMRGKCEITKIYSPIDDEYIVNMRNRLCGKEYSNIKKLQKEFNAFINVNKIIKNKIEVTVYASNEIEVEKIHSKLYHIAYDEIITSVQEICDDNQFYKVYGKGGSIKKDIEQYHDVEITYFKKKGKTMAKIVSDSYTKIMNSLEELLNRIYDQCNITEEIADNCSEKDSKRICGKIIGKGGGTIRKIISDRNIRVNLFTKDNKVFVNIKSEYDYEAEFVFSDILRLVYPAGQKWT